MNQIFRGTRNQRGHGIGALFKSLFRTALPMIKDGARYAAKQGLRTGGRIVEDLLDGKEARESMRERMKQMKKRVKKDSVRKIRGMVGGGKRKARCLKKKKKKKKRRKKKKYSKKKPKMRAIRNHDCFSL